MTENAGSVLPKTPATLRQFIAREIARLAASDVGARQDRAKVLQRALAEYDAQVKT